MGRCRGRAGCRADRATTRDAVRVVLHEVLSNQPTQPGESVWISIQDAAVEVDITSTRHRYGGPVRWYSCPTCSRRCRVLYLRHGSLACPQCLGLLHPSQTENPGSRKLLKSLHREWQLARLAEIIAGAQGGAGSGKVNQAKG